MQKRFLCSYFLFIALSLTSCSGNILSVHSDYLSRQTLASYYVKTPDPLLNNPHIGQRLIASWSLPSKYSNCPDLHLLLTIRYRNREEIQKTVPVKKKNGTYIYCLLNEEYCEKKGLSTYKVVLMSGDQVLEEWRHQLWAELILFEEEEYFDVADYEKES